MKRVKMILTNRFDPDIRVLKEAEYLRGLGINVEILCWDRENEYLDKPVEYINEIKIKRFYPFARYGSGFKQVKAYIKFIKQVKKYLSEKEYNYLHCHDLDGVIVGFISNSKKSKLIFDMHEIYEIQGSKQRIRYIIRMIVNFMQSKSDYIIYVNDLQKKLMKNKNKDKLIYIPNYPEVENFKEVKKTKSEKLRVSYIGTVRQFNELKNLMDASVNINEVKISIHGIGTSYKKLKDIEEDYYNAEVTGIYNYTDSTELYNNTDVLYAVYPMNTLQNKMSYPIKFFESIITLTPIIVSKNSVLEEFIKKYDIGFIVEGNNILDIKRLINEINDNKHLLTEKVNNLKKIQYKYDWNSSIRNINQIYR